MPLRLRLCMSLVCGVAGVSLIFAWVQTRANTQVLERDLSRHATALGETLVRTAEPLVAREALAELQRQVDKFKDRHQLLGVAVYGLHGEPLATSSGPSPRMDRNEPEIMKTIQEGWPRHEFARHDGATTFVSTIPLRRDVQIAGAAALFLDAGYIDRQISALWRRALISVAVQTLLITAITLLMIRITVGRPMARMAQWLRDLRTGVPAAPLPPIPDRDELQPLTHEVRQLASSLVAARAAATEEARLREIGESHWTPERLRLFVQSRLGEDRLFSLSNREPYEHVRKGANIECVVPASGLVTALEPILRACDGTWIAQATGNADHDVVDSRGRVRVPPDHAQYTLRRVWLNPEEQHGFYLGFANEGLWPLCHIAHNRPMFRPEDWSYYQTVNQKFADAMLDEIRDESRPVVLVQDYHFALVPRMIKERRPDARVALFWHIPWPNPEAFGICPWQRELLDGLLGADLIGFHIQAHCNNFLATVDRAMESRIDWERFSATREGHHTLVRPFPISVSMDNPEPQHPVELPHLERAQLLARHGIRAAFMGIGVDRVDYTKGIPEKFRAIERFLEKFPNYRREVTFVQIGSPSRDAIERYRELMDEVVREAARINHRFQTSDWRPILLLPHQHSHKEILPYYRTADFCLVSSLHDGMNLVAKEFIAARSDDQGVLILSRFAGASHELSDALIVNPYDPDDLTHAIHRALEMAPEERRMRMQRMRASVRERNIYRWAGSLLGELCDIRTPETRQRPNVLKMAVHSAAQRAII